MKKMRLRLLAITMGFCFMLTMPIFVDASPAGCIKPSPGLVSWWPGDGHAYDLKGGNHGFLMEGATFAPGLVGEAFSFDGVDDYVAAPAAVIGQLQELTIELWVKIDVLVNWPQRFVSFIGATAVLRHDGDNALHQLHFYLNFGGAPWLGEDNLQNIRVDNVLFEDTWYHVAGTYDGSEMRLYLNGELVGTHSYIGTLFNSGLIELSWHNEPLNGLLDEVSIYDYALSPSEIQAIYNAGGSGKCKLSVLMANLLKMIEEMNLQQGINNNLDSKVQNAQAALDAANAGNRQDAINKLEAFINAVEAQRGNALSDEQANLLVEEALRVIELIELYLP